MSRQFRVQSLRFMTFFNSVTIVLVLLTILGCKLDDNRIKGSLSSSDQISPAKPQITSYFLTLIDENQINVNWTINLPDQVDIIVAHQAGSVPPADCNSGTVDNESNAGSNLMAINGLPLGLYSVRICIQNPNDLSILVSETASILVEYCSPTRVANSPYGNSGETNIDGLSAGNAFTICSPQQLDAIGTNIPDLAKFFRLERDLDLSSFTANSFNTIGDDVNWFSGDFDGQGHKISNLAYSNTGRDRVGLFGTTSGSGTIYDLKLENFVIEGADYSGILIGYHVGGTVHNIEVIGGSMTGGWGIGGVAGGADSPVSNVTSSATVTANFGAGGGVIGETSTTITNVSATGTVNGGAGSTYTGGAIGVEWGATIIRSFATGTVVGEAETGGFIGCKCGGVIRDSYAHGNVTGTNRVGGFSGSSKFSGILERNYSKGTVSGTGTLGGFVGYYNDGAVKTNNFWDTDSSGRSNAHAATGGSVAGMQGKTTAQMNLQGTYTGWDFGAVWEILTASSYPSHK